SMPTIECGQAIRYPGFPPGSSGCLMSFADQPTQLLLLTAGHAVVPTTAKQLDPIEALDVPDRPLGRLLSWTSLDGETTTDAALIWVDPAGVSPRIHGLAVPAGVNLTPAQDAVLQIFPAASSTSPRKGNITELGADIRVTVIGPDWQETI